jgi:hypothetical protein
VLRNSVKNSSSAVYPISKNDPYIRTEILFAGKHISDSITIYLNPVYRFNGEKPVKPAPPEVNVIATVLYRLLGFCTLLFIVINIFVIRRRIQKRKK